MTESHPLKQRALELPTDPGVYVMKAGGGTVIYVGKAKNLRNRVNSYFGDSLKSLKTHVMVTEIVDFDIMITHSEVEAFLLERTLIKHHKPKFNILLKDDKNFPYIKVDFRKKWPKLRKVRKRKDDGATYLGPFANAGDLYLLMKRIYKIFPLIRCSDHVFKTTKRPCNYYHIKLCLAPCVLEVDQTAYHKMVRSALQILRGRAGALLKELTVQMQQAAEDEQFELAASLRDQIKAIHGMKQNQNVILEKTKAIDIVNFHRSPAHITFHVMWVRHYEVIGSHSVSSPLRMALSDEEILESFLLQYYERHHLPEKVAIPTALPDADKLMATLSSSAGSSDAEEGEDNPKLAKWVTADKALKEVKALLDQCQINAAQAWQMQEDWQQKNTASLNRLQQTLKLSRYPRKIECLDISNFGAAQKVAAIVVLEEGEYAKKLYKRYKIASVDQQDDYASIEEVVSRRIARGLDEDNLPDLLVIDGGKGQLSAALKAKAKFPGCHLEIVSLAKSRVAKTGAAKLGRSYERVYKPDQELAIPLIDGTPAFLLMTKIRDEAHRFAITYHRSLRNKVTKSSFLDGIKGVGKVLRGNLIQHFGTVAALKKAPIEEISQVKGVGRALAETIYAAARASHKKTS